MKTIIKQIIAYKTKKPNENEKKTMLGLQRQNLLGKCVSNLAHNT